MRELIEHALVELEDAEGAKVVIAAETGSRLTGVFRADSDYDVKGAFVRPVRAYLSLRTRSDSLRPPPRGLVDLHLLDVRRFVAQVVQGNPSALDVVFSPAVYRQSDGILEMLRDLHAETFVPTATASYFRSTAHAAFSGAMKRRRDAQGKEIGYAIRSIGRHAFANQAGRYPVPGVDLVLDEADEDDLRWIDERRETSVPDLAGPRFDAISSRIAGFLEAHAGRKDRNVETEMPESADDVLLRIVADAFDAAPGLSPVP